MLRSAQGLDLAEKAGTMEIRIARKPGGPHHGRAQTRVVKAGLKRAISRPKGFACMANIGKTLIRLISKLKTSFAIFG